MNDKPMQRSQPAALILSVLFGLILFLGLWAWLVEHHPELAAKILAAFTITFILSAVYELINTKKGRN